MQYRTRVYILGIAVLAGLLTAASAAGVLLAPPAVLTCLVLALASGLAQAYEASQVGREPRYMPLVFLFAGLLLLPPVLFAVMALLAYGLGWLGKRLEEGPRPTAPYFRTWTVLAQLLASIAALALLRQEGLSSAKLANLNVVPAVSGAALAFALVNNWVAGIGAALSAPRSWAKLASSMYPGTLLDLIFLGLGYVVAVLWQVQPLLLLPAVLPLMFVCQGLKIPQLELEAKTDPKTGLWNVRHFSRVFTHELARARQLGQPLAIIMADLDLLRNINSVYGHLAGDAVLAGVSQLMRAAISAKDLAARFGGEEFALVLPNRTLDQACELAEDLRQRIEAATFEAPHTATPINATISIGIACFPEDGTTRTELIHRADVAVYQAKLGGRNRVICAAELAATTDFGQAPLAERRFAVLPEATAKRMPEA